jgi:hypothetical protein
MGMIAIISFFILIGWFLFIIIKTGLILRLIFYSALIGFLIIQWEKGNIHGAFIFLPILLALAQAFYDGYKKS